MCENYPYWIIIHTKLVSELMHTNLCGPMSRPYVDGKLYFMTFIGLLQPTYMVLLPKEEI